MALIDNPQSAFRKGPSVKPAVRSALIVFGVLAAFIVGMWLMLNYLP